MNLDPHCVTCEHGKLLPITHEMGRTLFCTLAIDHCKTERAAEGKCGESAKNYRKRT